MPIFPEQTPHIWTGTLIGSCIVPFAQTFLPARKSFVVLS
jgi:hypothetical protein